MQDELDIMKQIDSALAPIDDDEMRTRILRWAWDKFGSVDQARSLGEIPNVQSEDSISVHDLSGRKEIPGIASIDDNGQMRLTVRDIKAKTANDAAIRLTHVAVFAYQKLLGVEGVSSKHVVVPILREWRAYDGNTRKAISDHKGIMRDGDMLTLDIHSKNEAEYYIDQILDDSVAGKWKPTARKKKTKQKSRA